MNRVTAIGLLLVLTFLSRAQAQSRLKELVPYTTISVQYAGSTGFVSAGIAKTGKKQLFELGLLYGYTPAWGDHANHSLSLKLSGSPFQLSLAQKLYWQPIQAGVFLCQNVGKNLGLIWDQQYPKGYYWWSRSTRTHLFFSTQFTIDSGPGLIDRIALYIEANTNDLYISSYFPNRQTMKITDIFFLGTGCKILIK